MNNSSDLEKETCACCLQSKTDLQVCEGCGWFVCAECNLLTRCNHRLCHECYRNKTIRFGTATFEKRTQTVWVQVRGLTLEEQTFVLVPLSVVESYWPQEVALHWNQTNE